MIIKETLYVNNKLFIIPCVHDNSYGWVKFVFGNIGSKLLYIKLSKISCGCLALHYQTFLEFEIHSKSRYAFLVNATTDAV